MKLRFISFALVVVLFVVTGSYVVVVDGGIIYFEGELVNVVCLVNIDSVDQVVIFG